jgi:hypothetical protein
MKGRRPSQSRWGRSRAAEPVVEVTVKHQLFSIKYNKLIDSFSAPDTWPTRGGCLSRAARRCRADKVAWNSRRHRKWRRKHSLGSSYRDISTMRDEC